MRSRFDPHRAGAVAVVMALGALSPTGCSRTQYRLEADRDAYAVIDERNVNERWRTDDFNIDVDPRSRYFDPYDPDKPPMPLDDPASQQYMQRVDGKKGWEHWGDNGERSELENPQWWNALGEYVEMKEDGSVKLNVDSALKLAYVHSPQHQRQLETLYLSALDVSAERFRLDTQFFGGQDLSFTHNGSLSPAALSYDPSIGKYVVTSPADGLETNRLSVAGNPLTQMRRKFASAGQLLAGFANSFVFEFAGGDGNLSSSLANFTFIQPLLRGAGRDIALEQLTFEERNLLANLRAYGQFRHGFYTQVAIGELGVSGPQRGGQGTRLFVFSGQGGVGGYTGLLQQLQEIRNSDDNLSLQLRALTQLEALLSVGIINLVQVDQFRQSVERQRSELLTLRAFFEGSLDAYKAQTLGLPPDLLIELDDSLIRQFQLVSMEGTALQDSITALQDRLGLLPNDAPADAVRQMLDSAFELIEPFQRQLDAVQFDLDRMKAVVAIRERSMPAKEIEQFRLDRAQLDATLLDLAEKFAAATADLEALREGFSEEMPANTRRGIVVWLGNLLRLAQRAVLAQGRGRLEAVTVDPITLKSDVAFEIALSNRLDFMNGRAALVDRWRLIQINADALQSLMNLTTSGDLRTARNNPVSLRAPTGTLRMGLEFDAPLTRVLERNAYRESLINYQQSRRGLIQSRDALHRGLRALLRNIAQFRNNLEIQRRAVAIALRRVDQTRAQLYAPVPPPRPGQRTAPFGPTAARDMVSALGSLLNTQNSFLRVWLNYYAARMRLARELGTMALDPQGGWIDTPPPNGVEPTNDENRPPVPELPPALPAVPAPVPNTPPGG